MSMIALGGLSSRGCARLSFMLFLLSPLFRSRCRFGLPTSSRKHARRTAHRYRRGPRLRGNDDCALATSLPSACQQAKGTGDAEGTFFCGAYPPQVMLLHPRFRAGSLLPHGHRIVSSSLARAFASPLRLGSLRPASRGSPVPCLLPPLAPPSTRVPLASFALTSIPRFSASSFPLPFPPVFSSPPFIPLHKIPSTCPVSCAHLCSIPCCLCAQCFHSSVVCV